MSKAIKYVNEHSSEEVAPYLQGQFASTSLESIAVALDSYKAIDAWVSNMAMTRSALNRLQDIIDNAGELPERVEFDDLVDTVYAQAGYDEVYG